MPGKMKAMVIKEAGGDFVMEEREIPEPKFGEVRVKVEACGMCHSDVFVKSGQFPGLSLPRIPGHEIAGVVDKVGTGVTMLSEGTRVGVGWFGGRCGQCDMCRRGDFLNCVKAKVCGISYDGGYAEYCCCPIEACAKIPDELSAVEAAPLLCAGVTTFNAMRNSGTIAGKTVAVQGIGGLGHLALQFANKMGFRVVALSRGLDKKDLCLKLGAHIYIDTKAQDAVAELQKLGGADLIIACAPHASAVSEVVPGLTPRGKLLLVAAPHEPISFSSFTMLSGKEIAGWPSGTSIDSEDTMAFSALTGVKTSIESFPLEKANEAYTKVMDNSIRFRAVLEVK